MRKVLWFFLSVMMLSLTAVSASAVQYVHDNGNLLTDSEEADLEALAESESGKYGISIVILTEDGIDGADPMMYAADFYDYNGFLDDGIILFLEMGERDWRIVNSGLMMDVVEDYELDYFGEHAVTHFSDGNYAEGFEQYITIASALTDYHLNGEFTGDYHLNNYYPDGYYSDDEYYDDDDDYYYEDDYYYGDSSESETGATYYVVALGISLLIAFLVCSGFKNQLNTAVKKTGAGDYFKQENANVTLSNDRFLYSRTSKVRKSSDSNSGGRSGSGRSGGSRSFSGSSGRSHSGGGGKF